MFNGQIVNCPLLLWLNFSLPCDRRRLRGCLSLDTQPNHWLLSTANVTVCVCSSATRCASITSHFADWLRLEVCRHCLLDRSKKLRKELKNIGPVLLGESWGKSTGQSWRELPQCLGWAQKLISEKLIWTSAQQDGHIWIGACKRFLLWFASRDWTNEYPSSANRPASEQNCE